MRLAEFQSAIKSMPSATNLPVSAGAQRELVLVQIRDADGFWCNVLEGIPVKRAVTTAERLAREAHAETRVVKGQKRDLVRQFVGQAAAAAHDESIG